MAIISNIRKRGQILNLGRLAVDIEDNGYLSNYFVLSEFEPKFSGGKNTFLINGSPNLSTNSPVQIEVLDSSNNSLYVEVARSNSISYTEGGALRVAVHVYSTTRQGIGKLYLVGTTPTGKKVRWTANIQIYPTLENHSSVVFYKPPTLKIDSLVSPAGNSKSSTATIIKNVSGAFKSFAVTPRKGDDYGQFDPSKQNVDYRAVLTINSGGINGNLNVASMVESEIVLTITQFNDVGSVSITSKNIISEVLNDTTVRLKYPIYAYDSRNRKIIADVTDGTFSATVADIPYDATATTSYSQSLAVVTYSNIDTFSGNVYRHKLYRKSLVSSGDYQLIADALVTPVDILSDTVSTNSYFSSLGSFPRGVTGIPTSAANEFVKHYWFTSSTSITASRDGTKLMDGMSIVNDGGPTDEGYVIVKNDTSNSRNAQYDSYVYTNPIASNVYDSNFISCSANTPYELSFKAIVTKNSVDLTKDASIGFYFTSSQYDKISADLDFDPQKGIKLGELVLGSGTSSLYQVDNPISFYSQFANDFAGTVVIYTKNCNAIVSQITLKNYTDVSFSPSIFVSTIPCPVSEKNQQFKFKSELFDIDHNLVYSNLTTIAAFDKGGVSIGTATVSSGGITTPVTTDVVTPTGIISITPFTPTGKVTISGTDYPLTMDQSSPVGTVTINAISWTSGVPIRPPNVAGATPPDAWLDVAGYKVPAYKAT